MSYVTRKYNNFSAEIQEYDSKNFDYTIFKNEVLTKAKKCKKIYGNKIN